MGVEAHHDHTDDADDDRADRDRKARIEDTHTAPSDRRPDLARAVLPRVGVAGLLIAAGLLPFPPQAGGEGATAFMQALAKTGYLFPLIKTTETVVGVLLLSNRSCRWRW